MVKGKNEEGKIWAFLGVFLALIGFLIVLLAKKDDKYAMYYAKHGLVLGIIWIVLALLNLIPVVGWIIYVIGGILTLIMWVIIFIAALSGEEKKFPLITDFAKKFNF